MRKECVNTLVKYKWQTGVYKIQDMLKLVNDEIISKQDFFKITRYNYDGIKKYKDQTEST